MAKSVFQPRQEVRCLLAPLTSESLLVPNALVVEILNYRNPRPVADKSQDWLFGTLRWRNLDVPIVSFEKLMGENYDEIGQRRRIIICHSYVDRDDLRFIGFVVQGLPRLISVDEKNLTGLDSGKDQVKKAVFSHVSVSDDPAVIPAMEKVGKMIAGVF